MRILLNKIFIFLSIAVVLLLFSSCSVRKNSRQSIKSSVSSSYYALGYSEFESDISQKEEILFAKDTEISSEKDQAELLRDLIILYSHKKNPEPDFVMALKYLKQYALIQNQISVEYVEALLDIMIEKTLACDERSNQYDKVVREKKKLERSRSKLIKEMRAKDTTLKENAEELKEKNEIIEKLKALDIQLENRRLVTE
jgi:hypothetical protein